MGNFMCKISVDKSVRLPLADLGNYKAPDMSHSKPHNKNVPAFGTPEYEKYQAEIESSYVVSASSGKSDSELYNSYITSPEFASECKSKVGLIEQIENSPSACFDGLGGKYGNVEIVGRGKVGSYKCGHWAGYYKICKHTHLHHNNLQGEGQGKVLVHVPHTWCHNPRCPICYKHGFASREARNAADRVDKGRWLNDSIPEHLIWSPTVAQYGFSLEKLRVNARKDLMAVGAVGGCLIFHGFRYRNKWRANLTGLPFGWFWSPHFHCVGFIQGGYSHCRNCVKVKNSDYGKPCEETCKGCSGFEGRVREYGASHGGVIIKIAEDKHGRRGVRQSIVGTLYYQLHHSSLDVTKKRFHILTWFGTLNYHKLKVEHKCHVDLCPLCQHEMLKAQYFGSVPINTDFNSSLFKRELFMDEYEDGKPVWVVIEDEKPNFG
jgi:hypothetical protein